MKEVVQSKVSTSPEKLFPECNDYFPSFHFAQAAQSDASMK